MYQTLHDWRHRIRVLLTMGSAVTGLYLLQHLLWPINYPNHGPLQTAWSWGTLLWLGAVLPGLAGLVGMLWYRRPTGLDTEQRIEPLVCWRIVSRGQNVVALTETIRRCQREMARTPLFPYLIEVVTDHANPELPPPNDDLVYLTVPKDYRTPHRSLFKARALHYAVLTSQLSDDAWIVHLDEETQPTRSGIQGIARMIREEEASGQHRIGQGAILYHRSWKRHPWLTLADMVRTGDDFARFHFQNRLGVTVFGMHGSYIVVRNSVEKITGGFDFGPRGSITEDAFWAVVAMEQGHRSRWCEGYLEEQSTQSVGDFLRQRRRWYQGLARVALYAPVKFRWRASIGLNTLLWTLSPMALLYTVLHFGYGGHIDPTVRALANASFASFATLYLVGLKVNLDEHGIRGVFRRMFWYGAQVVLLPAFSAMECVAVAWAFVSRCRGFQIIDKDPAITSIPALQSPLVEVP